MDRSPLKFPRSPFSTPLSGSAKETELRIRNIFQWKKKRPPVWLMVLMAAICLSCGSLVSCQVSEASPSGAADLAQRLQYDPDSPFHAFLDGLELDGTGDRDDAVFVLIPWGNWNNSSNAGPRYVNGNNAFGNANNNIGALLAS